MSIFEMWVVYDHPRDDPTNFVARLWNIFPGKAVATDSVMNGQSLEEIRAELTYRGFHCLPAMLGDDPAILETWI